MPIYNSFYLTPDRSPNPQAIRIKGPVIPVEIFLPNVLVSSIEKEGKPIPSPVTGHVLIDTGATISAVDEGVIKSFGINPIGSSQVNTPSGDSMQFLYPVQFSFPGTLLPRVDFGAVLGSILKPQGIIALFGRDILSLFVLVYNGPGGYFTLAY